MNGEGPSTPTASSATSWRALGPKRDLHRCDHTEWGSWSGELYVCDRYAHDHKHDGYDPRKMRRATPEEHRRIAEASSKDG